MQLIIKENYESMSRTAADIIIENLRIKPDLRLCVATGSTPTRMYELLVEEYKANPEIFSKLIIVKLDEWGGLPMGDPASCETYIRKHLIEPLSIGPDRYIAFTSNPDNPKKEIKIYQKKLDALGLIDICILGIGLDGHLGLNEPGAHLKYGVNISKLTSQSLKHPMASQAIGKIGYGITMGLGDIMKSKKIITLVNGAHKKDIFKKFLTQKITTRLPASMLWLHPDAICICDKEAVPDKLKKKAK